MFTVKATFRNETRKFTFEPAFFPSYEDIYNQLVKVFPVTPSYYLSRLFFSPNQGSSGSILIGVQADTEQRYNQYIAPYRHKAWPGALLRFTVHDDNADKEPSTGLMTPNSSKRKGKDREQQEEERTPKRLGRYYERQINSPWRPPVPPTPPRIPLPPPWTWAQRKLPTPPPAMYSIPVPPPPILYHSPMVQPFQVPMDIDPAPSAGSPKQSGAGAHTSAPQHGGNASAFCCDVSQGKQEMCQVIAEFMNNFERTMVRSFGADYRNLASVTTSTVPVENPAAPPIVDTSTVNAQNVNAEPSLSIPGSFSPPTPVHTGIVCDVCETIIHGVRHKCLDCPDYDMCTPCITNQRSQHAHSHEFFRIEEPGNVIVHTVFSEQGDRSPRVPERNPESRSLVVHNANCDLCDSRIRGDRYKCLNCPDFDTCSSCFKITHEQHPNHGFVIVKQTQDLILRKGTLPQHYARCDGCQKPIRGTRYKCTTCHDFDLCENCESHPIPVHPVAHHMLKIKAPSAAIPRLFLAPPVLPNSSSNTTVPQISSPIQKAEVTPTPVVRMPTPPISHVNSTPSASSEPDLISFPEVSQKLDDSVTTPTLPHVEISGSLFPDLNVLVETPVFSERFRELSVPVPTTPIPEAPIRDDTLAEPKSAMSESLPIRLTTPRVPGALTPSDVRIESFNNEQWSDLWPEMKDMLNTILQPGATNVPDQIPSTSAAVLTTPDASQGSEQIPSEVPTISTPTDLTSIAAGEDGLKEIATSPVTEPEVSRLPMDPPAQTPSPSSVGIPNLVAEQDTPLRATFLSDNNIPDGQIFPPGAEFVKSWKLLNDGRDWPETAQLMFVAGDKLTTENHQGVVKIGMVHTGEVIDVWTGEMKAPEAPGKYVSYWRLNDGQGSHFGHSLWADITVAEPQKADTSDEGSLASSSVIMPRSAPERSSVPSITVEAARAAGTSVTTTNTLSDIGSDDSDMFIVDMPSSPSISSGDSVTWQETREQITPSETGVEYVVLYDDSSDEDQN